MSEPDDDSTDRRLDEALGRLLRGGVVLAAAVVLLGGALYLAGHSGDPEGHRTFDPRPDELCHPISVVRAALHGDSKGIIQLGLLLLIATPVARVLFTVFAFAKQRDWAYVLITLVVLGLLLYSLFWGKSPA
jgi:uncharacterized membrane protein